MVVGDKNKKGRKKEKEGKGFGRLPSFFFPPFLFIFLTIFFLVVVLRCGDWSKFGCVLGIRLVSSPWSF